jgi:predicted permease
MKLAEAWHLSRITYQEMVYRSLAEEKGRMWWGAFGKSNQSKEELDDLELTKRSLRIARFDKMLVAIFNVIVALVPFASSLLREVFALASSISLSLAITFGLTALYAIQTLPAFVSAESSTLLSTLPIEQKDFSLINMFSFIRSIDYIVIGSILTQVIAVACLTGSFFAALIMLAVSTMNALFAVSIALWFSRIFQKNQVRGGRSKVNTSLRLIFILMWSLLIIGVGFLFSIPWYIVPNLEKILLAANQMSALLLSLVYPFSTGIVIANLTYDGITSTTLLASAALTGYALLSFLVGKWSLNIVKTISKGTLTKITRIETTDFSVKTRSPCAGYVLKDLKVASKNPATAFFFALPVLETVIVTLLISSAGTLRISMMLDATAMGAIFALFVPLALLTAEGRGLEYTKTLPITSRRIIASKALISTLTYVPVPFALIFLSLIKPLTESSAILIPFFITIAVASASIFEIKLFLGAAAKGKIAAIINDLKKLIIGVFVVTVSQILYATTLLWSHNQSLALLIMGAITLAELSAALKTLGRS